MYLLFDIGGTHTRVATSDGTNFQDIKIFDTPKFFEKAINQIKETVQSMVNGQIVEAACGGIACTLNSDKTACSSAANLPDWDRKPLGQRLEQVFNAKVYLENDTALECLGEAIFGVGKGYKTVGFLTIGTGVGGSKVVNGKIDEESANFEPGHRIVIEGQELENLISGPAIKEQYGDNINWDEICQNLEIGLEKLAEIWSPDIFILGGGVMNVLPLEKVKSSVSVVKGTLGDKAGLYGALEYLKQFHVGS